MHGTFGSYALVDLISEQNYTHTFLAVQQTSGALCIIRLVEEPDDTLLDAVASVCFDGSPAIAGLMHHGRVKVMSDTDIVPGYAGEWKVGITVGATRTCSPLACAHPRLLARARPPVLQ